MAKHYMKATVYEEKRARFPAFVQPKHNGIRCLWNGERTMSREGNEFKPHVNAMLRRTYGDFLQDGWVLDGELMLPKPYKLQDVQSAVKGDNDLNDLLYYELFDGHNGRVGGPSFAMRREILPLTVETHKVFDTAEVQHWYEKFLDDGHEGLIFRTDAPYQFGSGARHLMKLKPAHDEEFEIIGIWEGKGKFKGMPTFRLPRPGVWVRGEQATTKNSFGCSPEGTFEQKRKMWTDRKRLYGKFLTVRYWDKYASGVPQFPIGVCVRDYE